MTCCDSSLNQSDVSASSSNLGAKVQSLSHLFNSGATIKQNYGTMKSGGQISRTHENEVYHPSRRRTKDSG